MKTRINTTPIPLDEQKTHVKNVTKFFETFSRWRHGCRQVDEEVVVQGTKDAISIMETSVKGIVRYMSFGKIQQIMDVVQQI